MLDRWMPQGAKKVAAAEAPARASAKAGAAIDRQVLDQLGKVLTNGKPELLTRVINLYVAESPKLVQRLKTAGGAGDAKELAGAAHSLKSSSANVGANALSRHCEELEQAARRADLEEARRALARLEPEHGRVQEALQAELEQLTAKA
jgi:HPt (histidine-containing phosphotransfer) domain-containing protein